MNKREIAHKKFSDYIKKIRTELLNDPERIKLREGSQSIMEKIRHKNYPIEIIVQ